MNEYEDTDNYEPLFELGFFKENNPACRILSSEFSMCPITLAALVLGLFETVINNIPESRQNDFEKEFCRAFKIMLKKRFEFDITKKYFDEQ